MVAMKKYFVKMDVRRKVGPVLKTVSVKGPWADTCGGAVHRAKEYLLSKDWPLEAVHIELHVGGKGQEEHKGTKHRLVGPLDLVDCGLKPQ